MAMLATTSLVVQQLVQVRNSRQAQPKAVLEHGPAMSPSVVHSRRATPREDDRWSNHFPMVPTLGSRACSDHPTHLRIQADVARADHQNARYDNIPGRTVDKI